MTASPAPSVRAPRRSRAGLFILLFLLFCSIAANLLLLVLLFVSVSGFSLSGDTPASRVDTQIVRSGGRDEVAVLLYRSNVLGADLLLTN